MWKSVHPQSADQSWHDPHFGGRRAMAATHRFPVWVDAQVSLPSGSLCAERAGIARAASEFFHAKSIKASSRDRTGKCWTGPTRTSVAYSSGTP